MPDHFLHITDLTADEIRAVFDLAATTKARFRARDDWRPLQGMTLVMIFAKPSFLPVFSDDRATTALNYNGRRM